MFRSTSRLKVPNARQVVAVASGKGGVGKSTIAVNLAIGLAQRGYRVGLLDADAHGPNVPLMLGVRQREAARDWQAIIPLAGNSNQPSERIPALERYGVKTMSIGLLVGEEQATMVANVALVGLLVRNLLTLVDWGDLDILLLDFPPGTSEPQATLMSTVELDGAIIVVTPQDLSLLDSTRALRAFEEAGVPITGVVENMSYLICPHCGEPVQVFHRIQVPRAVTSGEAPLLAGIPIDPSLAEAGDIGRPILITAPGGEQARILLGLADAVGERLDLTPPG